MTATVVYDKSIYDVNSAPEKGRYGFTLKEDSAVADSEDGSSAEEAEADSSPETDESAEPASDGEGESKEVEESAEASQGSGAK